MDHEYYMRQALELAQQALFEGEVPVGCVIVQGERIVGRGRNRRETGRTALGHAEVEAIQRACEALGGSIVTDAFGVVAMVAMTPLLTIQLLGLVYQWKVNKAKLAQAAEDEEIIDLAY